MARSPNALAVLKTPSPARAVQGRGGIKIYDAVWTNVGGRVSWGKQSRLEVTFDGLHFITYADLAVL